jgi:hypothetical protein
MMAPGEPRSQEKLREFALRLRFLSTPQAFRGIGYLHLQRVVGSP